MSSASGKLKPALNMRLEVRLPGPAIPRRVPARLSGSARRTKARARPDREAAPSWLAEAGPGEGDSGATCPQAAIARSQIRVKRGCSARGKAITRLMVHD